MIETVPCLLSLDGVILMEFMSVDSGREALTNENEIDVNNDDDGEAGEDNEGV